MNQIMWIYNTIKFQIIEKFIIQIWYKKYSQEGSHIKYKYKTFSLIIPKHKEISRWTINNIFKIISIHQKKEKKEIENLFLNFIKK